MDICRRQFSAWVLAGLAGRVLAAGPRSKLLVLVLLEQFRPDVLESLIPQFGSAGFRRLLEKSAYFPDCRHLASTFSSSAIATLATGTWPAQHGIVADRWFDRASRKPVLASDEALLATTLAAQAARDASSRVFVVSMDQAQARLFAGTRRARVFWMNQRGEFVTGSDWPDWLTDFNRVKPVENLHDAPWMALAARPGAPPLRTLRFDPDKPEQFLTLYKSSPFGQEAQFAFLGELITRERLGQGEGLDFICLLAGSSALLGYETGGFSPLMEQLMLKLDLHLQYLLDTLAKSPGENAFDLALVGAHGAPPAPEENAYARMAVNGEALAQAIEKSLAAGAGSHVEKYLYPFLYLDANAFRDPEPARLAAARAALQNAAVADYYTAGGAASTRDEWQRRFRNSFHPRRSGDVMLSYRPEYVEDYGKGRGISYGSLYNYDVSVPLFLYGPHFRAGSFGSPVESVDVAPTLAHVMGVAAPSSATGRILGEALSGGD
ncbi:MAG: alkaline phosphatase family protein [Acidobacteriia bacterium]|nr:alkaline phosphatase family protein [Terriglobia bacterium]